MSQQPGDKDERSRIVALLVYVGVQPALARLIALWNTEAP